MNSVIASLALPSTGLVAWALPSPTLWALAYIDPGTGALILHMLVGAVVGIFVFARNQVRRFVAWFGGLLGREWGGGVAGGHPEAEGPGGSGSGQGAPSSRDS